MDFLFTAKRDLAAARRFLERAIDLHDVLEKITIDKSGANTAAIETMDMIRKGQLGCPDGEAMPAANQFYSLAA